MKDSRENAVRIAELKAKLSHHLRAVRGGQSVVILDRRTPIARLTPYREGPSPSLVVREATRKWGETPRPSPAKKRINSLKYLLEDRASRG